MMDPGETDLYSVWCRPVKLGPCAIQTTLADAGVLLDLKYSECFGVSLQAASRI
jgi:hypothetical protein